MVKDRTEYGQESQAIDKTVKAPYQRLKDMNLKSDFETLSKSPINQPVSNFVEKSWKLIEDIKYDNDKELNDLIRKYNEEAAKDYNRELEISRIFQRIKILYEKQIYRLMDMPDLCAEAIIEMLKIHNKTKNEGTD